MAQVARWTIRCDSCRERVTLASAPPFRALCGRVIHEPSMQRTSSPTAGMEPIMRQTSTGVLRAENRIVKGGQARDVDAHSDFAAAQRFNSEL